LPKIFAVVDGAGMSVELLNLNYFDIPGQSEQLMPRFGFCAGGNAGCDLIGSVTLFQLFGPGCIWHMMVGSKKLKKFRAYHVTLQDSDEIETESRRLSIRELIIPKGEDAMKVP
jgi:hypothetical protein